MASFNPSQGDALLRELSSRLQEIPIQLGRASGMSALESGTTHHTCPHLADPTVEKDNNGNTNFSHGHEIMVCDHRKKWTESSSGWTTPKSLTSSTPDLSSHHMRFEYEDHKETDGDSDDNQELDDLHLHSVDAEANLSFSSEPQESVGKSASNIFRTAVSRRHQETKNPSHESRTETAKALDELKKTPNTAAGSTENKASARAIKLSRPDHQSVMFLSGVDTLGGLPLEADYLSPLNRFPSHLHPRSSRLTNCSLGDQRCFRFWRRSSCPVLASTKECAEHVDFQETWTRSNTLDNNKRPFISCIGDFQKLKGFNDIQRDSGAESAVHQNNDCHSENGSSACQSISPGAKSHRKPIRESKNTNLTDYLSDESSSSSSDSAPSANSSSSADESC